MASPLRGTVYLVIAGVPIHRHVLTLAVDTEEAFQAAVRTRLTGHGAPPAVTFEFGPIGEPWGGPRG